VRTASFAAEVSFDTIQQTSEFLRAGAAIHHTGAVGSPSMSATDVAIAPRSYPNTF
jgi:hypothetical protein